MTPDCEMIVLRIKDLSADSLLAPQMDRRPA